MHFPILDKISKRISVQTLNKLSGRRLFPMVYHLVGNKSELTYANGLYRIPSAREFETELDFLLRHYSPIDLSQLHNYCQTGELPEKGGFFFLSFDDGLRQCAEIIAPMLLRKGIPATFFINTGFVDNSDFIHRFRTNLISDKIKKDRKNLLKNKAEDFFGHEFSCRYKAAEFITGLKWKDKTQIIELGDFLELGIEDELKKCKPYMSKDQISGLIKNGFMVGAHSIHHPEYSILEENEQILQTKSSVEKIAQWFNPDYNTFAFPFTDFGIKSSFFRRLKEECKLDISFGSAGLKDDVIENHIQRIPMDDRDYSAEQRMKSELLYYLLKKPLGRNKIKQR